ncbi:MAG TPA: aromatic aminobenezylarsenical efflux permease ArsG family transporter [Thermoanaerobaculia bacterium]|nr:aromatic aminobenezylarsenical efflux permease ArsG family transporter [Thermoanaerobaculia bacterium]HUM30915.1 aromatic aminobenezylarsenical efflux permease ArsG family transporter [Thermoanaerobaculia bacterium]HXK69248.1 aromatic aminobenezylarsenical efflux permease ArsG family transporter [Thermoanaerobaculia bacterium]
MDQQLPFVAALSLGLMTSISPCPLATNIAAVAFVSRRFERITLVLLDTVMYTLGRAMAYTLLAIAIRHLSLEIAAVANPLISISDWILGPILILVGILLMGWIKLPMAETDTKEGIMKLAGKIPLVSSFIIGFGFALAFCPFSASLFFGGLIPIALSASLGDLLAAVYGVGTALPVLVIGILLALGLEMASRIIRGLQNFEKRIRPLIAAIFILVGLYQIFQFGKSLL